MRVRAILAALIALQGLQEAVVLAEWVQVAVIEKQPDSLPPEPAPVLTTTATPVAATTAGDQDSVIAIRRVVGDSFSNKQGVVLTAGAERRDGDEEASAQHDDGGDLSGGLPFQELRDAHLTLLKQSAAPVSGKLDFLRRLRNKLLRHIATLVPLSARSLAGGDAAGVEEGRGHKGVGFPSNEGTLMSLAFLVFAVFLVKVVMQLIYAVQNSQYNNANAGVRVAQMPIPEAMVPAGMGGVMNMMPAMGAMMPAMGAMMPAMMAAMEPVGARRRARRHDQDAAGGAADGYEHPDVERMAARVLDAIHKAKTRIAGLGLDEGAP